MDWVKVLKIVVFIGMTILGYKGVRSVGHHHTHGNGQISSSTAVQQ